MMNSNDRNSEQETVPQLFGAGSLLQQSPIQVKHERDEDDTADKILIDHLAPVREQRRDYSPLEDQQSQSRNQNNAAAAAAAEQQVNMENKKVADIDLKKRINLFYHPLFQGALAQWLLILQNQQNTNIKKRDYLRLNVRVQKSLIIDFDFESAQKSAIEDWRIDYERQNQDQTLDDNPVIRKQKIHEATAQSSLSDLEIQTLNYERLCQFFFDLCVSWCQFLDVETFLFFIHALFLNMTKGDTLAQSSFKHLDVIDVMPLKFFNLLLEARSLCEQRQKTEHFERYYQWARFNMHRSHQVATGVQQKLKQLYEHAPEYDERLNELFPDFDTEIGKNFINSHMDKLDKNLQILSKATTQFMSTFYKQSAENRSGKKQKTRRQSPFNAGFSADYSQQAQSNRTLTYRQTLTREEKENLIEQRVLDAAPRYLEHGRLQQIRETSFLILNQKRLPIFGQAIPLFPRDLRSGIGGAPPIRLLPGKDAIKQEIIIERAGAMNQQYDDHQRIASAGEFSNENANLSAGKQTTGNLIDSQQPKLSSQGALHARKGSQQLAPVSKADIIKTKKALRGSSSEQISKINTGPLGSKQPSTVLYPPPSHSNIIQTGGGKRPVDKNPSNLRLISPISKTDYSGGGVSSSGIQLASGTFEPPKDVKDMVVIEAKKKKKKQPQNNHQISITVPAEKNENNKVLTNYDKPLITGISPDTSIEEAKFTSSGMIQSINEKDFNKPQSRGPPLNATASQFNGELAISPNLINQQTLKAIYDKYLERSPKQGLESNMSPEQLLEQQGNTHHPLSIESLRLALQEADGTNQKNFRTGNSSDFNGIKLAEILREQGLLIDRTDQNASKSNINYSQQVIRPIETDKISEDDKKSTGVEKKRLKRTDATEQTNVQQQQQHHQAYSSSGYKDLIQPGGVTGSSNFHFLRGFQDRRNKINKDQLTSSQQNQKKGTTTKNEQTQNQGLTTLSQDQNEKTARRMELIRVMLHKFKQQKEQGVEISGAENLLADYGSKAELFPENKTAYYLTAGKNATANQARQQLLDINKSPVGGKYQATSRRQTSTIQQDQQKFEKSPPRAKKLRQQVKYGVKPAWKNKFYPHDILNKKFYQNNISNYGRIMKKRIPKQAKYMSQTIRNQYTMDKQFQTQDMVNDFTLTRDPNNFITRQHQYRSITQKSQDKVVDAGSIQPSPQFADYQMYGYGPKYQQSSSPNAQALNKQQQQQMMMMMSSQQENNKGSRKAIPLSNYAVVQSLSLQSSSPRIPVQLQSQQPQQAGVKQSADEIIVNGVPQSAMQENNKDHNQESIIGGEGIITQTSGFQGGSVMMMMMKGQQQKVLGESNRATIGQLSSSMVDESSKKHHYHQGASQESTLDHQLPGVSSSEVNLPYVAMVAKKNIDGQDASNSQTQFKSQQIKNNTRMYEEDEEGNFTQDITSKRLNFQNIQSKYQPTPYDIEEYEHLFPHGRIPQSLRSIIDPLQFNYLLVKLKKDFNEANRSKFLGYMKIHFPEYVSRRDELGGIINEQDYYLFSKRLGMLFDRVAKKRSKMLKKKKRKHLKKLIPKSLIKNPVGPRMGKDPVWRSIFIHPDMGKKRIEYEIMKDLDEEKRPFYLPPLANKSSIV